MIKGRELWKPRHPELPEQCASCPFRVTNVSEFGAVVARLRRSLGIRAKPTKADIGYARMALFQDAFRGGEFICHGTAYYPSMKHRPQTQWRQCPGASVAYRTGRLSKATKAAK